MDIKKREKRVLIIGVAAVAIMLANSFIIKPFTDGHNSIKEEIINKSNILAKYKSVSANLTEKGSKLNSYNSKYKLLKAQLLNGAKPPVAAAALQKLLQGLTGELGIGVDSIRVSETKDFDYFTKVPVEITVKCRIRKLRDLMFKIDSNAKFMDISKLMIKVLDMKRPLDVEARIEVSGFILRKFQT